MRCVGGGGVSCNVTSAEAIFMHLLDRCKVCVCEGSLIFSAVAGLCLNSTLSVVKCVRMCVCGWGG